jgi:mannose-6-phosphate isomerase-like protein (cupin superfamily)
MDQEKIKKDWDSRGYSFGIFKDPPGKIWADFVHRTDELVVLAEGEIEIEIEGKSQKPQVSDEVFIPANALHTVRNVGSTNNVWYYGYKNT